MIADDNAIDLKIAKRIVNVTLRDVEVLEALNLDETANNLLDCNYDIALIDNEMPGGTTLEIVSMLNETFNEFLPPMIMVSGNDDPQLPNLARQAGFFGFIGKEEFTKARLRAEIQSLINADALLLSA